MTDTQRKKKHFEEKYFYTPDGDEAKRWYVTGDQQHRFYTVSRTSPAPLTALPVYNSPVLSPVIFATISK